MIDLLNQLSDEEKELFRQTGSQDQNVAMEAQRAVAQALQAPLRSGILVGNILGDIFTPEVYDPNAQIRYPIDLYRPDNADEFVAFTIPNQGRIPDRHVEGDYVTIPTYPIGSGIEFLIQYAREANWNVVGRALEVMQTGFVKKINDDGWHTILAAGFDRNLVVSDAAAAAGQFTKRLVSLMKLVMRRNAGGNSTSLNRGRLTHLYVSPEAIEDMRNWGIDEIDEQSRREIYVADDGTFQRVFGVNLVDLDELGDDQEYQDFYENVIVPAGGGTPPGIASGDVELAIGLDLSRRDSFLMPIREELEITNDPTAHRSRLVSYYGWMTLGVGVLDSRRVLLGSL